MSLLLGGNGTDYKNSPAIMAVFLDKELSI